MDVWRISALAWLAVNAITFCVYGVDKLLAVRGWQRISEASLLALACCAGSLGALMAMVFFHHKTSHAKFRYTVPLLVLIHFAITYYLWNLNN